MNFDQIILEPEQQDLFIKMVEMIRSVPRENRSPMIEANSSDGTCLIMPKGEIEGFAHGDPDALASAGLLRMDYGSRSKRYTILPIGFKYYEWLIKQQGKPVERIEQQIFRYLEFEEFKKQYHVAYRKLKEAEEKLWSADKEEHFTTIGHLCREVMQEFADQLHTKVMDRPSNEPKSHDKNRIRAIIEAKKAQIGKTLRPFVDALYAYWDALSDLVQRQEHGGQKEGEPVSWEDSRRIVFQTTNLMFELHKTFNSN